MDRTGRLSAVAARRRLQAQDRADRRNRRFPTRGWSIASANAPEENSDGAPIRHYGGYAGSAFQLMKVGPFGSILACLVL